MAVIRMMSSARYWAAFGPHVRVYSKRQNHPFYDQRADMWLSVKIGLAAYEKILGKIWSYMGALLVPFVLACNGRTTNPVHIYYQSGPICLLINRNWFTSFWDTSRTRFGQFVVSPMVKRQRQSTYMTKRLSFCLLGHENRSTSLRDTEMIL